jgi:hypothetical protein
MDITKLIKDKRPKLSEISVNSYVGAIKSLNKKMGGTEINNLDFLKDFKEVMKHLETHKLTTIKNKLTAIIVALDAESSDKNKKIIDNYQDELKRQTETYNSFIKKQVKTQSQKDNWIEYKQLVGVANDLLKYVKSFKNKKKLNNSEFETLMNAVLLHTHLEYPLRNDLSEVKIIKKPEYDKLEDKTKENWLVIQEKPIKMTFYFNHFKNQKSLGSLTMPLPKKLVNLYKIYFKYNKSDNLLVSKKDRNSPINPNKQTKIFTNLFKQYFPDKNISSSLIRHIIISHLTKNEPTILEKEKKEKAIETKFQHSGLEHEKYRKID